MHSNNEILNHILSFQVFVSKVPVVLDVIPRAQSTCSMWNAEICWGQLWTELVWASKDLGLEEESTKCSWEWPVVGIREEECHSDLFM